MVYQKYGVQPGKQALREAGHSMQSVANSLNLTIGQVRGPLEGSCRPSEILKAGLSKLLKMPVEDIFSEEALEFPHNPRMNPWKYSSLTNRAVQS